MTHFLNDEEWKLFDNICYISNHGNIKNINNEKVKIYILNGYKAITKNTTRYIHRMVAQMFIPNPENKPCVNHIDGNKLNNCVSNLQWCTHSENNKHAYEIGLKRPCVKTNKHKSVCMLNNKKEVICVFEKIKYADMIFNETTSGNIIRAIKTKIKAYGFYWDYYDNYKDKRGVIC